VEVSPTAIPPVCRLLDYGKYKYEQSKKERQAKKGQRIGLLRELRLRPRIEEHDLQAKIRTARKLLEEGNKLRLVVRFRRYERAHPELGLKVLQNITEALKEVAVVSDQVSKDERNMTLTLSPTPTKKPKEAKSNAEAQDSQRSEGPLQDNGKR
jgi:translation initiation factor IF-3